MEKPYICDTDKNTMYPKTNCHINGGECYHTFNKNFAKEQKQHENKAN